MSCCTDTTIDSRLGYANDLATRGNLDSARIVMTQIELSGLNEYNRHFHDLITIKLHDKSYQDITADTIIHEIIGFFEHNGEKDVLGEAYYYGGRVCRERGDAPQALDYFQKAFDTADENNLTLKGKASSQMGQLLFGCYLYDQAKHHFQKAIHYSSLRGDSINMMYNLRELGDIYKRLNLPDSAEIFYQKGIQIAHKVCPLTRNELELRAAFIDFFIHIKDYNYAQTEYEYIKQCLNDENSSEYILQTLANICIINKEYNEVETYAHKLELSESVYTRRFAYAILKELAKYRYQPNKLYEYTKKYDESQDDINLNASRDAVIHQNSLYNYSLRETENLQLKHNQHQLYLIILIITVLLLFVICITLLSILHNRKLKSKISLQLAQLEKLKPTTEIQHEIIISENLSVEQLKESMKIKFHDMTARLKPEELPETILLSQVYQKFYDYVHNTTDTLTSITENDWDAIDILINSVYSGFRTNLLKSYPQLSKQEYRICLLIKCRFRNSEIGKLTHKDKSSIVHARKRLFKKYFFYNGAASDFDSFIYSL